VPVGDCIFSHLYAGANSKQNAIRLYWQQMLEAVHTIHERKIIHGDLKPANFLIVSGQLKLIDFGIAKAIASDKTENIHRDNQVGTLNFMAPEAFHQVPGAGGPSGGAGRHHKMGRASDIWSLGCILYQMAYGAPPYHSLGNAAVKMAAICSQEPVLIPDDCPPVLADVLRQCLAKNPARRASIPDLLAHSFVCPELTNRSAAALPTGGGGVLPGRAWRAPQPTPWPSTRAACTCCWSSCRRCRPRACQGQTC
jgi:serine/threonine-protein kinase TTK/MPS1